MRLSQAVNASSGLAATATGLPATATCWLTAAATEFERKIQHGSS
jgi:hypothetical protein